MSMILDALRKSDRQRTRHATERLREGPPAASAPGHGGLVLLAAAGMLLAVALLVVALRWEGGARVATGTRPAEASAPPANAAVRPLGGELAARSPAVEESVVVAAAPPAAEPPSRTEIVDDLAAPPLAELPALRLRLSSLHLDIHAWAEDPAERFVLINLRRYTEGDRLPEGPTVRRILRNGVVLEFEGTLFTLPRQ